MDSRPVLILTSKKKPSPEIYQLDQKEIALGRDQSSFVVLESRAISRHHAKISIEEKSIFLMDLKSSNGTYLNGRRLTGGEKNLLRSGDKIRIEEFEMQFQVVDKEKTVDPYEITDTDVLEVKMIKKILKAIDKETAPSFEILKGKYAGRKLVLEGKTQTLYVGRDAACEWMLDEEMISRRHAKISKKWDAVALEDLGSKNGTFVNNVKIKEKQLKDGDSILLGTLPVRFRNPQDLQLETLAAPALEERQEVVPLKAAPPPIATEPEPPQPVEESFTQQPPEPEEELITSPHSALPGPSEIIWFVIGGLILVVCIAAVMALL
ncbi:MAG: FHA domain-containing protein [Deltaproteobacteria bacterium]|nr:FHA domain-containing protein [Deltaproteobacteria bacterium]